MAVLPRTRRFTVDEFERMVDAGVFASDDRVELIEGEIIEMTPIGPPHASIVDRLNMLMVAPAGRSSDRPGPGTSRLRRTAFAAASPIWLCSGHARTTTPRGCPAHATSSCSSRSWTRRSSTTGRRKAPLYARAGVRELWLVDIPAGVLDVQREPSADGYRDVRTLRHGESLTPLAFPDVTLAVDDILG